MTKDNGKFLIDVRWGVGRMRNGTFINGIDYTYIFTTSEKFILDHYPKEFQNSLLKENIDKKSFSKSPWFNIKTAEEYKLISPSYGVLKAESKVNLQFTT